MDQFDLNEEKREPEEEVSDAHVPPAEPDPTPDAEEVVTDAEAAPVPDESAPDGTETKTETVPEDAETQPEPRVSWSYTEPYQADSRAEKKARRNGALVYAGIMTALFAVCFGILILVLAIGGREVSANYLTGNGTRVIYVRDAEGEALTPGEIYAKTVNSVVSVSASLSDSSSVGAGVIMSADGYIITNYHVVKGAHSIQVGLYSGEKYNATLVGAHPEDDLALLKIKAIGLKAATFADSDQLLVGEPAYAIGHPGGLDFSWTFTGGWISATQRQVLTANGYLVTVVQTDASVNTGNSGGALIDGEGRVIGIVSMKLADGYDGIGFAIPSNHTLEVMQDIIENGSEVDEMALVNRPVIGITGVGVVKGRWYHPTDDGHVLTVTDEEMALELNCYLATHTGVWVISVSDKGSAKGVLRPGDVITVADGETVTTIEQMIEIFSRHVAGEQVDISFWRDGAEHDATLTLVASVD